MIHHNPKLSFYYNEFAEDSNETELAKKIGEALVKAYHEDVLISLGMPNARRYSFSFRIKNPNCFLSLEYLADEVLLYLKDPASFDGLLYKLFELAESKRLGPPKSQSPFPS